MVLEILPDLITIVVVLLMLGAFFVLPRGRDAVEATSDRGLKPSPRSELLPIARDEGPIYDLACPSENTIVWCGSDRVLKSGAVDEGRLSYVTEMDVGVTRVAASASTGRIVVGRVDGTVAVRSDADDTWNEIARHVGIVSTVAIAPDGKLAVSAGIDQTVQIVDLSGDSAPLTIDTSPIVCSSISFSPNGRRIAVAAAHGILLIDAERPQSRRDLVAEGNSAPNSIVISPDGRSLAVVRFDHTIEAWDLSTASPCWPAKVTVPGACSLAWVPDNSGLLVGDLSGAVKILRASDGAVVATRAAHSALVRGIRPFPNGNVLTFGYDGLIHRLTPPWPGDPAGRMIPAEAVR